MPIREINMDEYYKTVVDNQLDNDFFLHPSEANVHHRIARAEQASRTVPIAALDTVTFHPVVHNEVTPRPVASEAGPKHRLGEKPKIVKSLVNAAKVGFKVGL